MLHPDLYPKDEECNDKGGIKVSTAKYKVEKEQKEVEGDGKEKPNNHDSKFQHKEEKIEAREPIYIIEEV